MALNLKIPKHFIIHLVYIQDSLPAPSPLQNYEFELESEESVDEEEPIKLLMSHDFEEDDQSHRLSQSELTDYIRDVNLSQEKELLLSMLQQ